MPEPAEEVSWAIVPGMSSFISDFIVDGDMGGAYGSYSALPEAFPSHKLTDDHKAGRNAPHPMTASSNAGYFIPVSTL